MAETTPEFDFLAKTLIIGELGVGKTCLWIRYCEGQFIPIYRCTVGVDFRVKTITVDDKKVKLQIWDTAGQERFRTISRLYYRGTMGILLCYAINNRESFEKIEYWMKEVKKYATEKDICIVLVGMKSDLLDERVVSFDEGRQLAESLGIRFFETSAKENLNVDEMFLELTRDMVVALAKKKNEAQEAGTQLHAGENNRKIEINCIKCS